MVGDILGCLFVYLPAAIIFVHLWEQIFLHESIFFLWLCLCNDKLLTLS